MGASREDEKYQNVKIYLSNSRCFQEARRKDHYRRPRQQSTSSKREEGKKNGRPQAKEWLIQDYTLSFHSQEILKQVPTHEERSYGEQVKGKKRD